MSTDTVTILQTKGGLVAAKRIWLREGEEPEIRGYDDAKHFCVHNRSVGSFVEMADLLSRVERERQYLIIRGELVANSKIDPENVRRLLYANGEDDLAFFAPAARRWILIDFDAIPAPAGLDPIADPEAAVRYVIAAKLPAEFHGVSCWWQFTGSAGIKPGIRLRLCYWGSRPVGDEELKIWLPEADSSIFNPVQAIYIAHPIFEQGRDPIPRRSGVLDAARDTVEVPERIEKKDGGVLVIKGYAAWCKAIGDHPGGQGFNAPIGSALAAWVGKNGAKHDPSWLRKNIEEVIRKADRSRHTAGEIEDKIRQLDDRIKWTRDREAEKPQKQSPGAEAAAIAAEAALFHTPDGDAFCDIEVRGHRETWPVRSKAFKQWLSFGYYSRHGKPPSGDALEQALILAEGKARFEAPERAVHLRVARVDGKIYLDLADADWRAVEVEAHGWRIIDSPPVRFRRSAGMLPLPEPIRGGKIDDLRKFLNVDADGFKLAVSWLMAALGGSGPYPPLGIDGDSGAGKTSAGHFIRRVVDPSTVPSRSPSRSDHDLYVAAHNSYALHFENISKLPDWLSDALCRLSTGGGFATRQLYEDSDEKLFSGMRPVILDGIDKFIERADLANRAIKITLSKVADDKRRGETQLNKEFAEKHPAILGALLDAAARGLRELPNTRLAVLPRMADFALWMVACEGALWEEVTFLEIYNQNQESMLIDTIENDLTADAIRRFMRDKPWNRNHADFYEEEKAPDTDHWSGTAAGLLGYINRAADLETKLKPEWPKNPRALSAKLRRLKDGLLRVGIKAIAGDDNNRVISLLPEVRETEGPQTPQNRYF